MKGLKERDEMNFVDFMVTCRNCLKSGDFELLCLIMWRIWYRQNRRVHNSVLVVDNDLVTWAQSYLEDYKSVNSSVEEVEWGFGIIIRTHKREVMASSAQFVKADYSPQLAEAIAILSGLIFMHDSGLLPCAVESDAQVIVNFINLGATPLSEVGLVIHDIILFLGSNCVCSVSFVHRIANMVAHCLTKFSLSAVHDFFWMEDVAPCVVSQV
ncbi:hypothetical protein Ddye_004010 [Dipteronia dyeriana]|uniref:RNase H type-1 domain-containing protein n=1 Tax=Dipteronia dyeriana TaxID=168575 RepID=A0AAD9XTX4_9ROSI|nr:hypothetical protein Ddye_004010 [Dipteronia dyeriana]